MEHEKEMSPQESLRLIEKMIGEAKKQFSENGHLYLIWGWVVFFCSVSEFILRTVFHYQYFYAVWFLTWPVVIYQIWYLSRKRKTTRVRTYADRLIGFVWLTFVILAMLLTWILPASTAQVVNVMPVVLALYGMPTFLSGIALRFNPLVWGGISCWALCIATIFIPVNIQDLCVPVAMLSAWIIPGYLLKARFSLHHAA